MSRTIRNLVAIGSAMLLSVSMALPAFASEPVVGTNTVASGTGISVQSSTNTAVAAQSGAAISGPAVVNGTGTAKSGEASVELTGHQDQTNVQIGVGAAVAAGAITIFDEPLSVTADTTNAQQSTNWAGLEQQGVAITGAATATGATQMDSKWQSGDAKAFSGDAEVEAKADQDQLTIQASANIAAALGVLAFDEPVTVEANALAAQTAKQTAMITQAGAATTGNASATAAQNHGDNLAIASRENEQSHDTVAKSGDAEVEFGAFQNQLTVQVIANIAASILSIDSSVMSDLVAAQSSCNAADIGQEGAAMSGNATANGQKMDPASSGEAEMEAFESQHQNAIQAAIMLNGTFLTVW